jgi:cell division septation protein DedD
MSIISISQSINDSTPAASPETAGAKQRQQVVRAFAGTMALALVLAMLYLGGRIVTSRKNVNSSRPVVQVAALVKTPEVARPIVTPIPQSKPGKQMDSATLPVRRNVTPRPGEKYVQVAAFGPKALEAYLRQLESKGLRPLVAPGPADGIQRILIGPYTNTETLEQTRRTLQVVGMDSIVRSY